MATFFSGQVLGYWSSQSNTMYGTLTGDVTRSGNTVTLSNMALAITSAVTSYGTSNDAMVVNGTTTSFTVNFGSGSTSAGSYGLNNTAFTVNPTDTSATIGWSYVGNGETTGSGSFTVTFPANYTPPDTPTISGSNVSPTSNTITYGTTSFGNPSTGTVTLYGGTSANPTTVLDTYSSTGDHTFTHTGISPSTTYYYRAKASNGQLDSSYSTEISVTTADAFKLYGSVNGQTKEITKLYGSVLTPVNYFIVAGIAGNNNFVQNTFNTMYRSTYGVMLTQPSALQVVASGSTKGVILAFSDNTTKYLFSYSGIYTNQGVTWGFGSEPVAGNVQTVVDTGYFYKSKAITKLYGSVGGVTKRIF